MKHTSLFCLVIIFTQTLFGQNKYEYQTSKEGFEYIQVDNGKDSENLPLLIAFHYFGGSPNEIIADYNGIKNPVRIIIPKGNYKEGDGYSFYPSDYYEKDSLTQISLSKITVDSLAKFVRSIENKFKQKAIISGFSQGGDIALLLAIHYPELCKASLPFAAVIHSNIAQELKHKPIKKIPIYLFQGEIDKVVSVLKTKKQVDEIGKMLKIKLYTYPNLGHNISAQMKIDYSEIISKMTTEK
ncbi:MAG: dienelactone hydrolase family protein [Ferruginibacter sp.]|nr:hypothetical protein [Ferruginibacter sp.]